MSEKDQSNNSGLITIEDDVVINREGDLSRVTGKCFLIPIDKVQRNSFTGAFAQAKSKTESKPKDSLLVVEEVPDKVKVEPRHGRGYFLTSVHYKQPLVMSQRKVDPHTHRRALLNATNEKSTAFLCVEEDLPNSNDDMPF